MLIPLPTAAVYQSDVRVLLAIVVLAASVALLPRPAPKPLSIAAVCVVALVWSVGATLIWGTGSSTKVRFDFVESGSVGSWVLLACAIAGILAAASALRAFANGERQTGFVCSGVFVMTYVLWSCAVRFPPIIAAVGLAVVAGALWRASSVASDEQPRLTYAVRKRDRRLTWLVCGGAVITATSVFTAWATNHLRHFGQSCPWGMPGAGRPVLVGALTVIGTILTILGTRYRSHRPAVLVGVCAAAVCVTGGLELISWIGIGVNHYCFD